MIKSKIFNTNNLIKPTLITKRYPKTVVNHPIHPNTLTKRHIKKEVKYKTISNNTLIGITKRYIKKDVKSKIFSNYNLIEAIFIMKRIVKMSFKTLSNNRFME